MDWRSVRAQFDLDADAIHLAAFVLASHPRRVQRAIDEYRDRLNADPFAAVGELEVALEEEARAAAGRYLGVAAPEIALTDSTTMGLALIYNGLELHEDEEILTTTHDFYSTHEAIRMRAQRSGIPFRQVPLYQDISTVSADEIVSSVRDAIRPQTRALALTWVHSSTGLKLPLRAIADAVAEVNATRDEREHVLVCVDGVHALGNQDVSPFDAGCDLFVSGTHKWLFGPRGTGIVWGKTSAWDRIVPTIPTFDPGGIQAWLQDAVPQSTPPGPFHTPGGFHSFENRWALPDAFGFHLDIGRDRVAERTRSLAQRLKEGLSQMGSVTLITPMDPDLSAGIVCFEVQGRPAPAVVEGIARMRRVSASVTPYAQQYVRMGPSIVNSEDEIDETLRVLRSIV